MENLITMVNKLYPNNLIDTEIRKFLQDGLSIVLGVDGVFDDDVFLNNVLIYYACYLVALVSQDIPQSTNFFSLFQVHKQEYENRKTEANAGETLNFSNVW